MIPEKAYADRRTARIAGVLWIVATLADLVGVALIGSINAPNYLTSVAANANQLAAGVLVFLIGAFAAATIAIALYPVLKRYNEGLALGAVGLRLVEGMTYIISALFILSLLSLSQQFTAASAPDMAYFSNQGALLLAQYHWISFALSPLVFSLGALLYYIVFYQSRLVPRWLSGWGLLGAALCAVSSVLTMFSVIGPFSVYQVLINLPIAFQEMAIAVWLIFKGFSSPAPVSMGGTA
jgi:hypothetical protein